MLRKYKPSSRQAAQLRMRPDSVLLELPTRNLAETSSILTARLHMSTNAVLTLFAKVIQLGHGELKDYCLEDLNQFFFWWGQLTQMIQHIIVCDPLRGARLHFATVLTAPGT